MRTRKSNKVLSVHAIAGTHVMLFGLDVDKTATSNLLGFKIEKKIKSGFINLSDGRKFENTHESIVQEFMWSDYGVHPDQEYTYRISTVHGSPDNLSVENTLTLTIRSEKLDDGENGIYFNRGVAGSQAFSRAFGKYQKWYKKDAYETDPAKIRYQQFLKPEDVPKHEAFKWLSRGLEEALMDYIGQAKDSSYSIRASLYELSYKPAAQAFIDALERGVDVQIVHHAKKKVNYKLKNNKEAATTIDYKDGTESKLYNGKELLKYYSGDAISSLAVKTVGSIGLFNAKYRKAFDKMLLPRTQMSISHNKYIILLKDGKPIQVWTGSTNLTAGGIFGQSNVGHVIRDEGIAAQYYAYWQKLSEDPKKKSTKKDPPLTGMKNWMEEHNPNLVGPPAPNSTHCIFSPRQDIDMLQWYADRMAEAKQSVFFTAAFSMDKRVLDVVKDPQSAVNADEFQRYLLLEGVNGLMKDKMPILEGCDQNRIAWGEKMYTRKGLGDPDTFRETLTGLNTNVNYIHTKFMLIDALSDDPIVISGSANFSKNSTQDNDENMLIIRGNTRVADIYLGEFMRIFNHFKRRNVINQLSDEEFDLDSHLDPTSNWAKVFYKKDTQESRERVLFS